MGKRILAVFNDYIRRINSSLHIYSETQTGLGKDQP